MAAGPGVRFGQGYYLARPVDPYAPSPLAAPSADAVARPWRPCCCLRLRPRLWLERFRRDFEPFFEAATGGRMRLETRID